MGWGALAGAITSGGLSLLGDYLASEATQDENQRRRQHQDQINASNYAMQKEFAQMGLRWRVEDAKAAGLHPLAALGATGASASPSFMMAEEQPARSEMYSRMGQNLSRAINATLSPEEKAMKMLQIESMRIDNAIKQRQLDSITSPGIPTSSLVPRHLLGQNPLNYNFSGERVMEQPTIKSHSATNRPHQAAGEYTDYVFDRTATGLHPVPSKEIQEAIEDKFIPETLHAVRNYIYPTISKRFRQSAQPTLYDHPLPRGYEWGWKPSAFEWRARKKGKWFMPRELTTVEIQNMLQKEGR